MGAAHHLRLRVKGPAQGCGFRPFVYQLAARTGVTGWVCNDTEGVLIEAFGASEILGNFEKKLLAEGSMLAGTIEVTVLGTETLAGDVAPTVFQIIESRVEGSVEAQVALDTALCPDCLRELLDPSDRRHGYPFTHCAYCGPRFSILESLPYDRSRTTLRDFPMCDLCRQEYESADNRRFHAQAIACPQCGPTLQWWAADGSPLSCNQNELDEAANALRAGAIVAVKGLGGFHLMADMANEKTVAELRRRKRREEKPLAVMLTGIEEAETLCLLEEGARSALLSPESPIVLLPRELAVNDCVAPSVAHDSPHLGVMLPYTPLHFLLLKKFGRGLVATSGNRSEEPIYTDETDAVRRLGEGAKGGRIADYFLVHNRRIARPLDDSVVRFAAGGRMVLRAGRGFAPQVFKPPQASACSVPLLCVGGHLKNTVAVSNGRSIFVSQHIGDLDDSLSREAFRRAIVGLQALYCPSVERVVCDAHPDYASSIFARNTSLPVTEAPHHLAHALSVAVEHGLIGERWLGVVWDGTGHGNDGTAWGGEWLAVESESWKRLGHFRPFRLPGGDAGAREPRRSLLGLLWGEIPEQEWVQLAVRLGFGEPAALLLHKTMEAGQNAPLVVSGGRLFDAVAVLLGWRHQRLGWEGQAAVYVESLAQTISEKETFDQLDAKSSPLPILSENGAPFVLDTSPLLRDMLASSHGSDGSLPPPSHDALRFHLILAKTIAATARQFAYTKVLLSGGCFQNRILLEMAIRELNLCGIRPYWNCRFPANDGGLAVGQAAYAAWWKRE